MIFCEYMFIEVCDTWWGFRHSRECHLESAIFLFLLIEIFPMLLLVQAFLAAVLWLAFVLRYFWPSGHSLISACLYPAYVLTGTILLLFTGRWLTAHSEDPAEGLTGPRWSEGWGKMSMGALWGPAHRGRESTEWQETLNASSSSFKKPPQLHLLPLVPALLKTWIIHLAVSQLCFYKLSQSSKRMRMLCVTLCLG